MQVLVGKVVFAAKQISEKYTVMCHEIDLLFMNTNEMPKPSVEVTSFATLALRDALCKTPLPLKFLHVRRHSGRDEQFRVQSRLRWHGVLSRRQERFARQVRDMAPDSKTGLIMGDPESFPYQLKLRHGYGTSYYRTMS